MKKGLMFLSNTKVLLKMKRKFYYTAIRPETVYGMEYSVVKNPHKNKTSALAKMRMLC